MYGIFPCKSVLGAINLFRRYILAIEFGRLFGNSGRENLLATKYNNLNSKLREQRIKPLNRQNCDVFNSFNRQSKRFFFYRTNTWFLKVGDYKFIVFLSLSISNRFVIVSRLNPFHGSASSE